jgi:hypothetical protein
MYTTLYFSLEILYGIQYNVTIGVHMENDELVQNMLLELRRGVLSIAVLSQLSKATPCSKPSLIKAWG